MKKLKDDIVLIVKGIKEISGIRSGLLSLIIIRSIFSALSPFVNIYMSALIINSITEKHAIDYLLSLAVITVAANFLVAVDIVIIKSHN